MNTRLLMRASALLLGVLGACATFLPHEVLVREGTPPAGFSAVLVQIAGALYLGFAMLNWMAQHAPEVVVGTAAYAVFAVLFAVVAFGPPTRARMDA